MEAARAASMSAFNLMSATLISHSNALDSQVSVLGQELSALSHHSKAAEELCLCAQMEIAALIARRVQITYLQL
jgi:hypothetical protein